MQPAKVQPTVPPQGLTVDDYLGVIREQRHLFRLRQPAFGLRELQGQPGAGQAMQNILRAAMKKHGLAIYAKRDSLLDCLGDGIYAERVQFPGLYAGYRIASHSIESLLKRAWEVGLQTIVQLPSKDPKPRYSRRRAGSFATALRKLAAELMDLLKEPEFAGRIEVHDAGRTARLRLGDLATEMHWAASTVDTIAALKIRRTRGHSPNPQVRFAMYLVGWMVASTGRPHYTVLKTLISAAFDAAHQPPPAWVDRLDYEAHLRSQRWRRYLQAKPA